MSSSSQLMKGKIKEQRDYDLQEREIEFAGGTAPDYGIMEQADSETLLNWSERIFTAKTFDDVFER